MAPRGSNSGAASSSTAAPAKSASSRFLGRRSTEDGADRAISEHFPDASVAAVAHHQVDGMSMREYVIAARRAAKGKEKQRLGPSFWRDVEKKYLVGRKSERFECDDKDMTTDPQLWEALRQSMTTNAGARSRAPLIAWLQTTTSCNAKECVALCRYLAPLKPSQNQATRHMLCLWVRPHQG